MQKKLYFENIDLLRGFAAFSVLVYHVIELSAWKDFPISGPLVWFRLGWMGVDLFFVISGMVIGLSAFKILDKNTHKEFWITFLKNRILRIAPLYLLTLLIFSTLVMPSLLFERFLINSISHLLFIHNLHPSLTGAIDGPNWSVAVEMQFYILMVFLSPWLREAKIYKIIALFLTVALFWKYLVVILMNPAASEETFKIFHYSTQLPGILDEFLMGILLARFFRSNYYTQLNLFFSDKTFLRLVLLFASIIFFYLPWTIFWQQSNYWNNPLMIIFFRTLLAFAFSLIIFSICFLPSNNFINFILKPFRYLGKISYGVYLWHLIVILSLQRVGWLTPLKLLIMTVIITFIFASWSWFFFEKPILNLKNDSIKK